MKRIYLLCMVAAAAFSASAQSNVNTVVQVTNRYQGKVMDADKNHIEVMVPDSLHHFDLNFDYSGFERPYGGNAEFNMYRTALELAGRPYDGKTFYLKAGAGYSCAPVFQTAYTFKPQGKFKAGLYAMHDSYFGRYNTIGLNSGLLTPEGYRTGFDSNTTAGVEGRLDLGECSILMDLGYEGIHAKGIPASVSGGLMDTKNYYNGLALSLDFISNLPSSSSPWAYKVDADYAFGYNGTLEHNAFVCADVSYRFKDNMFIDIEAKTDLTFGKTGNTRPYSFDKGAYTGFSAVLTPEYHFTRKDFTVGAGLAFKYSDVLVQQGVKFEQSFPFMVYPTLKLNWAALPGHIDLYADANVESKMFSEREKAKKYRFFILDTKAAMSTTYVVDAGIRGNIVEQLSYDVSGGYEWNAGMPLVEAVKQPHSCIPVMFYDDLHDAFVAFDMRAVFHGVTITADLKYRYFFQQEFHLVRPSDLHVGGQVRYDYRNRLAVYAGASYESAAYAGNNYKVPGFVNLTAGARYFITRNIGVFLEGENLLNQNCQFIPLYSCRGICITGGLTLNF